MFLKTKGSSCEGENRKYIQLMRVDFSFSHHLLILHTVSLLAFQHNFQFRVHVRTAAFAQPKTN